MSLAELPSPSPLDDFRRLLQSAPEFDLAAAALATSDWAEAGPLANLAGWLAGVLGRTAIRRPILVVYASASEGVASGAQLARQRLEALASEDAHLCRFARSLGAGIDAFDLAIDRPSRDASLQPSASAREVAATVAFGMEAVAKDPDLLILSDVSQGADRNARAILMALLGLSFASAPGEPHCAWTETALARLGPAPPADVFELLADLSGREICALTGALIAARVSGVPVLLEGPAALAAGAIAARMDPRALDHIRLSAPFTSPLFTLAAARLNLAPIWGLAAPTDAPSFGGAGLAVLAALRQAETAFGGGASAR